MNAPSPVVFAKAVPDTVPASYLGSLGHVL